MVNVLKISRFATTSPLPHPTLYTWQSMMIEGADSADRPTQDTAEIEITPEMIEAGVRELVSYDMTGDYDGQEVVSAVLAAAFAIRSDRGGADVDRAQK